MNRKPSGLLISRAVEGFGQFKQAEGLSARTVDGYSRDLGKWLVYQGDQDVTKIKKEQLRDYLTYLLTEYEPQRITGNNETKLSPKTVRNVYITLSAFFHWVSDEFQI
jgi:site-specific recombinase XerD